MGLGKRHEPLDGQNLTFPGVGNYDLRKDANTNSNPTWKFGTNGRSDVRRNDWPGVDPGNSTVPN